MYSRMGRYNSNARNRAFNRTVNGNNLTPAIMSSNDRTTSVRSVGTLCPIIQASQQTCQESATAQLVTISIGIGLTANGTLTDSESSASDSTRLMIDMNVPYVSEHNYPEVDGVVKFDVTEMIHNQQFLGGRKRKLPDSFSVNIADSGSSASDSTCLMIDLNVPYVPDCGDSEVYGAVGFDVNEMIHNQQCLRGRKRKAPDSTSVNIADSESSASDSTHHMIDLNVPYVPYGGDSEVDGFDVTEMIHNQKFIRGRKRKSPDCTSVNRVDSESFASYSTHLMIDLNVPYVSNSSDFVVDGAVGFDVNEMTHNQQCLHRRKRKAPDNTSVNIADSESFLYDSTHLMIDLNVPYVPDGGDSEADGEDGFDVTEMIHNQQFLRGRKRKAPDCTSVNIAGSESSASYSTHLMIDLNIPYVLDDADSEVDGAVGFDVNEMIQNQQCLRRRKRKAPNSTSVNLPDQGDLLSCHQVDILGFHTTSGSSSSGNYTRSRHVPGCTVSDFVWSVRNTSLIPSETLPTASSSQSTHFPGASRIVVENSTHITLSEQHTNFHGGITSASRNQSNAFIQPYITHEMMRDFPESALRYQSSAVIHPSSGPVRYLRANGVRDTRRAANFLRGHSMINDIDPPPLPLVIGETVAADNRERLMPTAGSVRETGHRYDPIVIEDDEEDEHDDAQQGVIRVFVGNLSYEQLLALQERTGDASTGLKKKVISELLKQGKYQSTKMNDCNDSCCVCLDTYSDGEELGKIDCGHEFHYHCIRKWLKIKNSCPICKMTPFDT